MRDGNHDLVGQRVTWILTRLFGRLPIGWLQLSHSKTRLMAALAGVSFANILVFVQLGILGALNGTIVAPYAMFDAQIMLSSSDANTLTDGSHIARAHGFEALGVPGVSEATPLYIANIEWQRSDGATSTLQTFALDAAKKRFMAPPFDKGFEQLILEDTVLIDRSTRGLGPDILQSITPEQPYIFEANNRTLSAVGTLEMGGGFSADGMLMASDQTFFRLFANRIAGAPNHILIKTVEGINSLTVVERLREALPETIKVQTVTDAALADQRYQTTERPTGIIFGFGVLIGLMVGVVIVYQILSTDVADHLREYATFKAMGYPQSFFLGIVFEEAMVLAVLGFIPGVLLATLIYSGMSVATGLPVAMDIERAIVVFLGTLAACAVSGAIATRRLAAADPADLF